MPTITLTDPVNGTTADATLIANNNAELRALLNGGLVTTNLAAGASITDTQLASANNALPRLLHKASSFVLGGASNGDYMLQESADAIKEGVTFSNTAPSVFYWEPADYSVGSKTTKWVVRAQMMQNAGGLLATAKVGVYPVSSTGGSSGLISVTLGTVVAGSQVTFTTTTANSIDATKTSGDVTPPAAGFYALGLNLSAGPTNSNSAPIVAAQLYTRHV